MDATEEQQRIITLGGLVGSGAESGEELRYTTANARRERLVAVTEEQGYCTTAELSRIFGVSEMTVRRDVAKLVAEGRLRGVHGGVSSLGSQDLQGSQFNVRLVSHGDAKNALAARALELSADDTVIALDAGTTVALFAEQIPATGRLRVVTASLPVITALSANRAVEVVSLGGVLHPETLSFAGPSTVRDIEDLQVETLFLAASSLSERGAFCANDFDALTKRALIAVSHHVVLLADSSKFAARAMVKVCGWDAIDTLITDDGLDRETESYLVDSGVKIIKVPLQATVADQATA
ncbi:DeoR/GlpR family DNA-binding transcription regulator [Paenarthrobacter sp. NPDC089714]|uniref:DeoR/GlpR family DNA-binding transcription regulator n=1 Tax=Paenarthrobacter sp. NPDC089714 TaxID=3364377 RepID=UPI0037F1A8C9